MRGLLLMQCEYQYMLCTSNDLLCIYNRFLSVWAAHCLAHMLQVLAWQELPAFLFQSKCQQMGVLFQVHIVIASAQNPSLDWSVYLLKWSYFCFKSWLILACMTQPSWLMVLIEWMERLLHERDYVVVNFKWLLEDRFKALPRHTR